MTTAVTVAVVGAPDVAKELGKKGTSSDLTLFNTVTEGHATTLVEPTQFPDKYAALPAALAMADVCLLVVSELTRPIAETIATVELSTVPTTVVLGPAVGEGELARALKGGRLEAAPRLPLDFPKLREVIDTWRAPIVEGPVMVAVDHSFPVKGVGAVALGVVRRGTLHGHDRLRLWPAAKVLDIRSIQVHDIDRKEAECGERVGIALKGVDADELSRGQILAPDGSLTEGAELRGVFRKCRYYRGDAALGAAVHLSHGLQVVPAEITELGPDLVRVTADRPVARIAGAPAYLIDLSVPAGPRLIGGFTVGA
ncbi:MAG TPA: EF-Tu/IF-2/RF-3 family GTPase [Thermoplasmata archaeon]|nr:EF-Tu/IF-2/RF-3 family GTPase [Thermoplasmata archaeon]